ncbi:hypothetical protein Vadar_004678 [Vaccinium darrowii]|uniref:Uncharacterized protein n=1 Tax=Vaccinium darrowii TaxID=229202 RepID=A0ACB7Y4Z4_9ERIC|nr:hypothetical protein Vadar_004678 [Vaccinium darrowii]
MEKHRCKLCFKTFANGRALGGHMRSHVMNLYSPPKSEQLQEKQQEEEEEPNFDHQFGVEFDSASSPSSSSSSEGEENEEERDLLAYGLRENPKKSVKLVNPEFSFAGSVVVIQDRESETESSKNLTRRRSKRIRKLGNSDHQHHQCHGEKAPKKAKSGKSGPWAPEPEPMSSISDTSPEEDVAYCLMMLSRDNWMREKIEKERDLEEEGDEEDDQSDTYEFFKPNSSSKRQRGKGKYKCETCFKLFKSYQALGGHRASHKKARGGNGFNNCSSTHEEFSEVELVRNEEKIHECPVCFRVFASGQALGGHKRSHVIGSQSTTSKTTANLAKPPLKFGESFIDLNLPAPIDDDDDDGEVSQIELSAVSDPEFVKTH